MLEDEKIVPTLSDKIKELIEKYRNVVSENEDLRREIVGLKVQNEALNSRLRDAEDDLTMKNLTDEELYKEIEDVLNNERA
ncbi:hypothetical protein F1B92_04850 [Campylobacter sp. FMV-PI01]|uniref:DUF904 domain-containing protein n=1 Tax=Campylobacter portucalensis TaxID=2608384 RepID=A0A6L5WLB5_9BACT|nr:hypothetical protein [Campylobacter portucalensis]MSN96501.1 hypothetical protein [Campylobacter portucalensis]